ncbi:hypothetical protein ZYGR_0N06010 [Zygosaccharomyces rouxii]|uniref:Zn(2)-C6 fungal-type domain-containing protein n=1 Tax=Zygosaccharomyces rouxii TaxID=4956 RepID=A0A1Q3A0G7_ZYGRO|nr:hypothetical protein ZYGR_0N06010 [Zygosaccharomyces rouxii]
MAIEHGKFDGLGSPYLGSSVLNANPNSNSNSRASANAGSVTVKKKRMKPIKSCTFCRRRKLRCDQQKPMCSTCIARELPECVYMESSSTPRTVAGKRGNIDSIGSMPNTKLLLKVNELERQLRDVANKISGNSASEDNSLGDMPQGGTESLVGSSSAVSPSSTSPNSTDAHLHTISQKCVEQHHRDFQRETRLAISMDTTTSASVNPLRKLYFLQSKRNGRKVMFGPTSMRTFLFSGNWGLMDRFKQLREKVNTARCQIKKECGYCMLRENQLIEMPSNSFTSNLPLDTSLAKQLIFVLPSYEEIEKSLRLFFSKPELYEITGAFDEKKVLNDFKLGFVPGIPSLITGERPVINIVPFTKIQYYKVGVVLGILVLVRFGALLPQVLEKFFVFLSGLSTAKIMYVERVQFTLLRYFHRNIHGLTGGDESHQIVLIDSLVCDAISLGLNRNIKELFRGDEELLGNTDSLEKLWCWVVFLDFSLAFHIGRPMKITEEDIFHEEFFDDYSCGFYGLLKRFLRKMARPIMQSIYSKSECPYLDKHCEELLTFTEEEFLPISFYTDKELIHKTPLQETRILGMIFSMLLCLGGLKLFIESQCNLDAKNSVVKIALVSFSVARNALARSIELDEIHFPELTEPGHESPSPYFAEVVSMFFTLFIRGASIPYILAYNKLTLFEKGVLVLENGSDTLDCDMSTLRVPKSKKIPTVHALSMFCKVFDDLRNPSNDKAKSVYQRCQGLQILLSMEKVQRTVVQKVLEVRTATETTWKAQVQRQGLASPGKALASPGKTLSPPSADNFENADLNFFGNLVENSRSRKSSSSVPAGPPPLVHPTSEIPAAEPSVGRDETECEFNTRAPSGPAASQSDQGRPAIGEKLSPNMEVFDEDNDVLGMISGDFWECYNTRWTELLNRAESGNLFSDIDI